MTYAEAVEERKRQIKALSVPRTGEVSDITAENIYDKAKDLLDSQLKDEKSGLMDETEQKRETLKKSLDLIDTYFRNEESNIQSETDAFARELEEAQKGFE